MAVAFRSMAAFDTNAELTGSFDFTVGKPSGTANDDLMLAFIQTQGNVNIDAAPAGWTSLHNVVTTTTTNSGCRLACYWKKAASEGSNYTWSLNGSAIVAAVILSYTGVHLTTPINASNATSEDTDDTGVDAPSVTTDDANCMLVTAHACNPQLQAATVMSFTGYASADFERYDSSQTWDGTTLRTGLAVYEDLLVATGPTGIKTATAANDGKNCGVAVALKPVAGGGGGGAAQAIVIGGGEGAINQCMYGWHDTNLTDATEVEAALGKGFAVFRAFQDTRLGLPSGSHKAYAEAGRLLIWSVKADDWGDVASGAQDAWINSVGSTLQSWSVPRVIFVFYHEPGGNVNGTTRTAAKYNAAWQRISDKWHASGYLQRDGGSGKILLGYTEIKHGNAWPLEDDPLWTHSSGTLPAVIDLLTHDDYNEIHSTNGVVSNQLFGHSNINSVAGDVGECWYAMLQICEAVQKPLIIAEFGSVPGEDNAVHDDAGFSTDLKNALISMGYEGNRDGWFDQAADFIKGEALARKWLRGFCYYHSRGWVFLSDNGTAAHPTGEDGINSGGPAGGVDGRLGWIRSFVNDPYFTATQFNPMTGAVVGGQGGGIASSAAFGVPSLALGSGTQAIQVAGIASSAQFGVPTLGLQPIPRSPTQVTVNDPGTRTVEVVDNGTRTVEVL